ncbi:MAG: calcium/sodium antiporter [Nocardioides sp.]|nr:calcium/sodium antiporter [Nocardioides sp.]
MVDLLLVVGGLAALVAGAELMVGAGTRLALWLGVRPILIGLTVVSIGTSVPELAIGIGAALGGSPSLAVGNIAGTNLVNILAILGLSALIRPVAFDRRTLRFELPVMTVAALAFYLLALDGRLGLLDGLLLLFIGVIYTWLVVRLARREEPSEPDPAPGPVRHRPVRDALVLLAGMAVIVVGAELLVRGAARGAAALGVSEAVIGLTVVAIGTSAPELVTTVVSTLRGNRDIAIGNLLGSSIYNIALVLGATVVVAPGGVPVAEELLVADLVLLVATAVMAVPVFVSGSRVSRVEGGLFLAAYAGYLVWLLATRV